MPNPRYDAGVRLEKRVSKHLRDEGYYVLESRGSHGLIDVIGVKYGEIVGVQAKGDGKLSTDDWNALVDMCRLHRIVPLLACRAGRDLIFWELVGHKVAYSRNLPRRHWTSDTIEAAG